jgi:predicted nuclease of predicted toxin-antitoxin system
MFDENMSSRVAKALNLLGKDVTRTPAAKRGEKGRADDVVARSAKRSKRFVFTNNYDMVVAAVQENARVIWFYDKNHNSPTKFDTAWLFFRKWNDWEQKLSPPDIYCLRVSMDRTTVITKEAAYKQASALDRKLQKTKRRVAAYTAQEKLAFED